MIDFTYQNRIVHKYWGLGYKEINIRGFIFYECLFKADHTKLGGYFRNQLSQT